MTDVVATAYCNGEVVDATDPRLPALGRGVVDGLGFFETFRTVGGRPHHWSYNRRRLERAGAAAGLAVPPRFLAADEMRLREVVHRLLQDGGWDDAVFRYLLTSGRDAEPSEFLTLRPLPPAAPLEGVRLRVLKLRRDNAEFLPRPKSLNCANALRGADELARRATTASDEGLFLSREGCFVVETTRQNLAWFSGNELHYPDPSLGAVAGTCLEWLLEDLDMPAVPERAPFDELLEAEAILVCNAVRGITPVHEIWDTEDRAVRRTFDSAAHPRVCALRGRWEKSLSATAAFA